MQSYGHWVGYHFIMMMHLPAIIADTSHFLFNANRGPLSNPVCCNLYPVVIQNQNDITKLVYGLLQVDVPLEVVHLTDEYWNNVVNILSFIFLVQFP